MLSIVVVGGGYAGTVAALRLGYLMKGAAKVTLINPCEVFVERIRLHQSAAGASLAGISLPRLLNKAGVEFVLGRAKALDLTRQVVHTESGEIGFDRVLLATGSRPQLAIPGGGRNAVALDSPGAARIREFIQAATGEGGRVLIVGGGISAIELAAEIKEARPSLSVKMLASSPLLNDWGPKGRTYVGEALRALGVDVAVGQRVIDLGSKVARCADGSLHPYDLCVVAAGFEFDDLARRSGLSVTSTGQVLVDGAFRAKSHPCVYVAGDCAAPEVPPGDPLLMGCKSALPTGAHVAENINRDLRGAALVNLDIASPFFCLSLGRKRGVVQLQGPGAPTGAAITGWLGARLKELVSKSTSWTLWMEARGYRVTAWKRTGRVNRCADGPGGAHQASPASLCRERGIGAASAKAR